MPYYLIFSNIAILVFPVFIFRSVNALADQSKQKAMQAELFAHLKNRAAK